MNIHLGAIGWVSDAPPGHRLRWHYPLEALDANGMYLGLPNKVIVERAPLDSRDLLAHPQASMGYPVQWWDQHGDITLASVVPLLVHPLPKPAQAVVFTWRGANARILFTNAQQAITERFAVDGEKVYVEASRIETIIVLETHATLENLRTLDLFADRGLHWRALAEITVAGTFAADFAKIAPRYEIAPTITAANWTKLVELANDGTASTPAQAVPGNPTDWQSFELILGCRWEYALLSGFAFFDGPRTHTCELDRLLDDVLHSPGNTLMAYRVRDADGRADVSNLVLVAPALAAPLNAPTAPVYDNPVAWLHRKRSSQSFLLGPGVTLKGGMLGFSPLAQFDGDYGVRCSMRWQQSDPRAMGVEIDEIVSASAIAGSPSRRRQFLNRTRRPEDVPPDVSLARSFDVDFPDVTLRARGRAIDAWDRASAFSAWSAATPLGFQHEPEAPPLAFATYDAGTVRIKRAVGVTGVPDWQPDAFVSKVGGELFIYRQTTAARAVDATFGVPLPAGDGLYRVDASGVTYLADFAGGSFSIAGLTETIRAVIGTQVEFRADGASFMPGQARLVQDLKHPALWTKVAAFPIANLPVGLEFGDPLPAPVGSAVESYCARLAYHGRLGPAGNIVRALRVAAVPVVPPPFTVEFLGIDYFHRTMLKIAFTTPVSSGRYSVWWADGVVAANDLGQVGASGHYVAQEAQMGALLYDVISLPIPRYVGRTVTIGVQRVVEGGLQSNFTAVPVVIPPLLS